MNTDEIKTVIETAIPTEFVLVESADNVHFTATVVSEKFTEMTKIQQHKFILNLFKDEMANNTVHALSLKTYTPKKWATLQE